MDAFVINACCMINLFAAGGLRSRLSVIGGTWYVPSVVATESLYVHEEGLDGTISRVSIELQTLLNDHTLLPCTVENAAELDLYVDLATQIDDGEAMALAIARMRGWTLATDDRKAGRLAAELSVSVLTTPDLMKRWADSASPDPSELQRVLCRIEQLAAFAPSSRHPLYDWWRDHARG